MTELFADLPEAIENTIEIARRCAFRPREHAPILPQFLDGAAASVAQGETEAAELRRQSEAGLARRLAEEGTAPGYDAKRLRRSPRLRARRHHRHELSGLLPDRRRLHPMGQGEGHSGRAGTRLRRRLARRLGADHHRSRPHALRAAVRALPQPRARVDAGLRHRFLPGPPRRGDRLCARALRRRPRRPHHHLRQAAGARGAARRRPRAADALWPGRPAVQARADNPANPVTLAASHRRRAAAAGGARRRADRGQAARYRPAARGALSPRLDPCRRRGHRRPAADRPRAALPRPARPASRHPVQHEMGRGRRAREVRLPRPQDADRDRDRARAARAQGRRARSGAGCPSTTPRPTSFLRAAIRSACSSSKVRACATLCAS